MTEPAAQSPVGAKWRAAAVPGWQAIPNVLLTNQADLGLSAVDMVVLLNVLSFWWDVDRKPFPRVTLIAGRMDVAARTVQRSIQKLVDKGLLRRGVDVRPDGTERQTLDPEGLVQQLETLARQDLTYDFRLRTGADGPRAA